MVFFSHLKSISKSSHIHKKYDPCYLWLKPQYTRGNVNSKTWPLFPLFQYNFRSLLICIYIFVNMNVHFHHPHTICTVHGDIISFAFQKFISWVFFVPRIFIFSFLAMVQLVLLIIPLLKFVFTFSQLWTRLQIASFKYVFKNPLKLLP